MARAMAARAMAVVEEAIRVPARERQVVAAVVRVGLARAALQVTAREQMVGLVGAAREGATGGEAAARHAWVGVATAAEEEMAAAAREDRRMEVQDRAVKGAREPQAESGLESGCTG